jgi:hypothetical protein
MRLALVSPAWKALEGSCAMFIQRQNPHGIILIIRFG